MSTNTSNLYVGLDIAKSSLQVNLQNFNFSLPNSPHGHRRLIAQLKTISEPLLVVCEATGGYEKGIVAALHQAGLAVAIVEPARVRHFAKACGLRAKTDRIDAQLLAEFGRQTSPRPQAPLAPNTAALRELSRHRAQLQEMLQTTLQQSRHLTLPVLRKQNALFLRQLRGHLQKLEKQIDGLVQEDAALQNKARALQQVAGVRTQNRRQSSGRDARTGRTQSRPGRRAGGGRPARARKWTLAR